MLRVMFLVAAVAAVAGGVVAWRCRSQALAWVQPPRTLGAETPPAGASPRTEGGWLTAPDGTRLRYWFTPGAGEGPRPAVVLLHGLSANRDAMVPRAAILARHGFGTLILELRAHGASGGEFTTLGDRETEDVPAALAYLASRPDIARGRIALLGHSIGAVVALRAAAARPEVRAVVAESAFVSVEAIAPAAIGGLTGRRPVPSARAVLWMMDWLTAAAPSGVRADDALRALDRPVLLVHGAHDPVAPLSGARTLAGLGHATSLFVIETAAHADLLERDAAAYERRVTAFLLDVL